MTAKNGMILALATALLAAGARAAVTAVSEETPLDTRSLSRVTDAEPQDLDTCSRTAGWSAARRLNTRKIVGSAIIIR
ncbi:MAG TPA: hypothetical protein P5026_05135 [Kiritimatiellia bacterium]|nr:hypothetical protein [Kiritimatiellia bacterium]HRS37444.1 hypothetical protein [Thermoanaerobaculia bacterium]HRU10397.1 hypothetical protein [Thermoanaerobaculia bacterium]